MPINVEISMRLIAFFFLVLAKGFEPPTHGLGNRRSILWATGAKRTLTISSAILTHPFCTPHRRIKTSFTTLSSPTFFTMRRKTPAKVSSMQGSSKTPLCQMGDCRWMPATLRRWQRTLHCKGRTPAMAPLLQAGLPQELRYCRDGNRPQRSCSGWARH